LLEGFGGCQRLVVFGALFGLVFLNLFVLHCGGRRYAGRGGLVYCHCTGYGRCREDATGIDLRSRFG
jgi:hypothetical protein